MVLYNVFGAEYMKKELLRRKAGRAVRLFMRDNDIDVSESFFMEMNSEGEVSIKGAYDISEYTDVSIFITTREYFLDVKGSNLKLRTYSKSITGICGEIGNISFMKR